MSTTALVHIGSGKAGSTTIQHNLFAWRKELKKAGILIPEAGGRRINEVKVADMFGQRNGDPDSRELLWAVKNDIRERNPRYVVFSSEYMWQRPDCATGLKQALSELCDEIRVILFLREPVGYYLSLQQQALKATDILVEPRNWMAGYRRNLSVWRSEYGDKLDVVPFQERSFSVGVAEDFLRLFAGYEMPNHITKKRERSNVSEHGEVTYLMQRYFRNCYPLEQRKFRKDADVVRTALDNVSRSEHLGKKASLLPKVQRIILCNNRDDLVWLKEVERIEFDAVDYGLLHKLDASEDAGPMSSFDEVADICNDCSDEILMKSVKYLAEQVLELDVARSELQVAHSSLSSTRDELDKTNSDLVAAQAELGEAHSSLVSILAQLDETHENLASARAELDIARSDIAARRSKVADRLDWLDYKSHLFLSNLPFASTEFRSRMRLAADKRHRRRYDE